MSDAASRLSETELAELCALADGTLPAERRAAVEARVAASPELQELVERQRRAVAAARALESEPVPASLQAAVEAERRPARRGGRGRPRWLLPRVATAVVVAAAIAIVAAVLFDGGPGAPTIAEAAQFAAAEPSGAAPRSLGDGARLAVDVEGVVFPDLLRSYGWQAVAVNRGRIDGREATAVVYEKGGRRLVYVVVAGDALPWPPGGESTTRNGVRLDTLRIDGRLVVTWRRLGHTCVLIGDAPRSELLTVASWRGGGALAY